MRLFRFDAALLPVIESALASVQTDVDSGMVPGWGLDDWRKGEVFVMVCQPTDTVPEIVRGLLDSRRGAA